MGFSSSDKLAKEKPALFKLGLFSALSLGAGLIAIALLKLIIFRRGYYSIDLSLYSNMLYNAAFRGRGLFTETQFLGMGFSSFLNDHFAPSIFCLVPLFRLDPDPQLLLMIPCFCLAVSFVLIFQISRDRLGNSLWAYVGASGFWLAPLQSWLAIDVPHGFHPDCILPMMIFATVLAWRHASKAAFGASLVVLLGLRENMPVYVIGIACFLAWHGKIPKSSAWKISLLALAFIGAIVGYGFMSGHSNQSLTRVISMFRPGGFAGGLDFLWQWKWTVFFWPALFFPACFVPVLVEIALMLGIGESGTNWHAFPSLAFLSLGWIYGVEAGKSWWESRPAALRKAIGLLFAVTLLFSVVKNLQIFYTGVQTILQRPARFDVTELDSLRSQIPGDAILSTTTDLQPRFFMQEKLCSIYQWKEADYVLLNICGHNLTPALLDAPTIASILAQAQKGEFHVVAQTAGGLLLLQAIRPSHP